MHKVLLCADSASARQPQLLGLDSEILEAQPWMKVVCTGQQARDTADAASAEMEAWVVSCDDVDSINLAATLKRDCHRMPVRLVDFNDTGSLRSRASAAGIDEVLNRDAFLRRYAQMKQEAAFASGQTARMDFRQLADIATAASYGEVIRGGKPQNTSATATQSVNKDSFRTIGANRVSHAGKGYTLAVVGAGGGVGKSTIAALTACFAQGVGLRTVLVDASLQFGDIHHQLGIETPLHLDELCAQPDLIMRLQPQGNLPAVLAAPRRLEQSEELESFLPGIIGRLADCFDVVIISMGPVWTEGHLHVLAHCQNSLFVMDQRPSSVRACQHALSLCSRCGIAIQPFLFAINRCARSAPYSSIDVSCALQGAHVVELAEGGRTVDELMSVGRPVDLIEDRNALCVSLERFLAGILPGSESEATAPPSRKSRRPRRRRKAACL